MSNFQHNEAIVKVKRKEKKKKISIGFDIWTLEAGTRDKNMILISMRILDQMLWQSTEVGSSDSAEGSTTKEQEEQQGMLLIWQRWLRGLDFIFFLT